MIAFQFAAGNDMKGKQPMTKDKANGSGFQDGETQNNPGPFSWKTDTIIVNGSPFTVIFPKQ